MQAHQQSNRLGRSPNIRSVAVRQSYIETIPIDPVCQNEQRMIVVEQLLEPYLKQIQLADFRSRFGLHADLILQAFDPSR